MNTKPEQIQIVSSNEQGSNVESVETKANHAPDATATGLTEVTGAELGQVAGGKGATIDYGFGRVSAPPTHR